MSDKKIELWREKTVSMEAVCLYDKESRALSFLMREEKGEDISVTLWEPPQEIAVQILVGLLDGSIDISFLKKRKGPFSYGKTIFK